MPRLKVTASTNLHPTEIINVNSDTPHLLKSSDFEGEIAVYIKDFQGEGVDSKSDSKYFEERAQMGKAGLTWGIVVSGRFLEPTSSDEIVFGNVFDKPIRDHLPYGTSVALKFINWIDPPLTHDLYADQPWAMSPLLATMNFVSVQRSSSGLLPFPNSPIKESPAPGLKEVLKDDPKAAAQVEGWNGEDDPQADEGVGRRRAWFGKKANRDKVLLGPEDIVITDFCNGYIDFNTLSLSMPSVGLHIPLTKYWDGQPVKYVCRNRDSSKIFWSVSFEIVDDSIKPVEEK